MINIFHVATPPITNSEKGKLARAGDGAGKIVTGGISVKTGMWAGSLGVATLKGIAAGFVIGNPVVLTILATATVAAAGVAVITGASDVIEGAIEVGLGISGSDKKAYNPVRDTVFQGDEGKYNTTKTLAFIGAVSGSSGLAPYAIAAIENQKAVSTASVPVKNEREPLSQPQAGDNAGSYLRAEGAAEAELPSTLNPKEINFMQSSIKNQTGPYTVLENAQALKNGTLKPSDLPNIKVWQDSSGKIWTLDHRRLGAFREAGLGEIPVQWATQEEIASQMWKMTTKNGGASIKLKLGNGESIIIK